MSASDPKDDVDRLFDCFKCGIATPQSALLEKKRGGEAQRRRGDMRAESSGLSHFGARGSLKESQPPSREKLCPSSSMACKLNGVKHISPVVFYGSPHGVPAKKPARLLRLLREIHVDLKEQEEFNLREEVWATFPRQEEAVRFAKTHERVHLFSYQDHLNGQRRFLVCTYEEFWRRYERMDSKVRHHYEVIQEGLPCHLYFDLEFNKRDNPERNADEMVDILVSVIFSVLFDKYSIEGKQDWIMELDSSTVEKFSRHLIIRIPQTAFKDNGHIGAFVSELCSRICSASDKDPQLEKLFIRKNICSAELSSQLFVDTGVYSRNRCFRLVSSSKAGKNSVLLPTRRFRSKNMNDKEVFMESLICRMDADCRRLLVCKLDLDCKKSLLFDFEVSDSHEQRHDLPGKAAILNSQEKISGTYLTGRSPFPNLDSFIEAIGSLENTLGKIRSWYWFSEFGLMIYSMLRSRYCERIGREHKSNHVMYVVDFRSGIYYQKCYDPDCKGYRSPFRPLPKDVVPDGVTFSCSTQRGNREDSSNVDFDFQLVEGIPEEGSIDDCEWITESCKKDRGWWQEALNFTEHIERMRQMPESCNKDVEESQDWWMDAESFISKVEENHSLDAR
ncbi:unnamed protein product [Spirodela intermedia]|uniref:DNA-directed primase/polymerase protein n=1 Tax=Spirodela intermedia TaxID=51605 RepID=A0A7I8LLN6_SPIIN|nr:unnamed protein product [Spirodela intermedia]